MILRVDCIEPNFEKHGGLVPVIVQEYSEGQGLTVLMLAYANPQSHSLTLETGYAHFWSRSRQKLWKKGETSGVFLTVKQVFADCDRDTLLYLVTYEGSVCHTGKNDCFFNIIEFNPFLEDVINPTVPRIKRELAESISNNLYKGRE